MKTLRIVASVVLSTVGLAFIAIAPALAADPFGDWLTGDKKGKVRIVNCGGALCGVLVWLEEPLDPQTNQPKIDKRNADASKQSRPLLGIPILLSMNASYTPDQWLGPIYNAEDGKTYPGSFTMYGPNTAQLKGCVLGGLICKAQTWTRTTAPNENPSSSVGVTLKAAVPLKKAGGTFVVPVQINGAITLDFTVDSGATDVTVPADVFSTLVRTGTIRSTDLIGEQTYGLADGAEAKSITFFIRSLRVGNTVVQNVKAGVVSSKGSLLLGQSFLERFKSWSIDNTKHVLLLD
jgi:clan AA aspartic protease (TIGR02281 family)